jgi:uncharacterized membrane protein YphA (DoxX/SURF4 family)
MSVASVQREIASADAEPSPAVPGWRRALAWALLGVTGLTFLVAAWGKLGMERVSPVPTLFDQWVPAGSVWREAFLSAEITLGVWLLSGIAPRRAAAVAAAVLIGFTAFLIVEVNKYDPKSCGCLQLTPQILSPDEVKAGLKWSIGRNVVLLLSAGFASLLLLPDPPRRSPARADDAPAPRGFEPIRSLPDAARID